MFGPVVKYSVPFCGKNPGRHSVFQKMAEFDFPLAAENSVDKGILFQQQFRPLPQCLRAADNDTAFRNKCVDTPQHIQHFTAIEKITGCTNQIRFKRGSLRGNCTGIIIGGRFHPVPAPILQIGTRRMEHGQNHAGMRKRTIQREKNQMLHVFGVNAFRRASPVKLNARTAINNANPGKNVKCQ